MRPLFAPLDPALEARFADETVELHRRRLRLMAPVMCALHLGHILFFHIPASLRPTLSAEVIRWRDLLVVAHAAMLPPMLLIVLFLYRERRFAWLGPLAAVLYLQHGAWVAGIDQIVSSNVSVYIGYCLGIAVMLVPTPRVSLVAYAAGAASLVTGLFLFQRSPGARLTNLPTCATLTVVSVAFCWHLYASRRRDFAQRIIIDRQRDELTALNTGLSERVEEQVGEIVAHAAEVDRLNAQLRAQVRARSEELSLALARLARERTSDGSLPVGLLLAGRFEVAERLGKGGMGTVYAGIDKSGGGRVAIKVIQAGSFHQLESMRRFIREVGATAAVSHPAVVRMLHLDVSDDGLLFQVQELVEGETLTHLMGAPWPAGQVARLGATLCDALAVAHQAGVVHRDVKPDNLMLTPAAPGLKLLDFGIAKLFEAGQDGTAARLIIGTPGYMAPEQSAGADVVTDRADVYAAGVLLFQLLLGRMPGDDRAPWPILDSCLRDLPADRPTAAELRDQLAPLADPELHMLESTARRGPDANVPTTPMRRGD